jgi:hypothetical protein
MVGPDLDLLEDGGELADLGDLVEGELAGGKDVLPVQLAEDGEVDRIVLKETGWFGADGLRSLGGLEDGVSLFSSMTSGSVMVGRGWVITRGCPASSRGSASR